MPHLSLALLGPIEVTLDGLAAPCGQSFQAELHHVQGELLLARDGLAVAKEALTCFVRAMRIGAEQGALAWELRAAMSLAYLRKRLGDVCAAELAEARESVRSVDARFAEGVAFPSGVCTYTFPILAMRS